MCGMEHGSGTTNANGPLVELPQRSMRYIMSVDVATLKPSLLSLEKAAVLDVVPLHMKVIDFRHETQLVDVVRRELPKIVSIEQESYGGTGC
eukprot:GEMP01057541.1.p1 GENE.GEMP01057541.1~~GEMP01057541.1.p1  ORF type:complete len:101 (+),score=9.04 GEMP01057541.1:28-303(+)